MRAVSESLAGSGVGTATGESGAAAIRCLLKVREFEPPEILVWGRHGNKQEIALAGDYSGATTLRWSNHFERPHHFIVLMFNNVTVPDVSAGVSLESNDDARDHRWLRADRIFPSRLARIGRHGQAQAGKLFRPHISRRVESLSIENQKTHHMQMDGMGIVGEVDQIPDLDRIERGIFGYRRIPMRVVQQHS